MENFNIQIFLKQKKSHWTLILEDRMLKRIFKVCLWLHKNFKSITLTQAKIIII